KATKCIGINIEQNENSIKINQKDYIELLAKKFNIVNAKPIGAPLEYKIGLDKGSKDVNKNIPYQCPIGSLMYLAVNTRPDIAFSSTALCYVDADWANDKLDLKSYSGYVFTMSDAAISWQARKQSCISLSSTEAEYVAIPDASKEAVYLQGLLNEFVSMSDPVIIYNDSQSAQKLLHNASFHNRSKHIEVRYHYVRDLIENKKIEVKFLSSADICCLPLPKKDKASTAPTFILFRNGVIDPFKHDVADLIKVYYMIGDILLNEDDNFIISGTCAVHDSKDVTLRHMLNITPTIAKKCLTSIQYGYPLRPQGIYISNSPYIEVLYNIIKPFLNEKMKERINIFSNNELQKVIPLEILPKEYGGQGSSVYELR
ncbi:hypothetical protein ILUMI_01505, partial [Ignelater luminosus]